MENRTNKKIAILLTEGFEQVEMTEPRKALEAEGFHTELITPDGGQVKAWDETNWGETFTADKALSDVSPEQYDALLLPGGVMNPDTLRQNPAAVEFVESFFEHQKPVAAICHAPMMLIEADVVEGMRLTSFPSLKMDLRNAGAEWVNEEVVVDGNLVTSRNPGDIPAFNREMIKLINQSVPAGQQA